MTCHKIARVNIMLVLSGALLIYSSGRARAHCDSLDGPVIADARAAIEKGDVTLVLKWVKQEYEKEVREVFSKTMKVRKESTAARELADRFFFETLVRLHRAGEGAPYTGLKPGGSIDRAVVMADEALRSGSPDKLVKILTGAVEKGIRNRFKEVARRQKRAASSVKEGRNYVEAYVDYVHFVEILHQHLKGKGHH